MSQRLINGQLGTYNIARTIGHCTVDQGHLCTSIKINPFSKYKPFNYNVPNFASNPSQDSFYGAVPGAAAQMAELESDKWAFAGYATTDKATLKTGSLDWLYDRPTAPNLRRYDFLWYYHYAPPCLMQAAGTRFVVDLLQNMPDTFPFYILFRTGNASLVNKKFEPGVGIGSSTAVADTSDFASCMTIEDLWANVGSTFGVGSFYKIIDSTRQLGECFLGLVIFPQTGSSIYEYFSSTSLIVRQTVENDMFKLNMSGLSTIISSLGEYTAVACARWMDDNYTYMPVFGRPSFPARFTLDMGVSNYEAEYLGAAEAPIGPYTSSLSTGNSKVYIKVRLYNYGNKEVTVYLNDPVNQAHTKVYLLSSFSGSVIPMETEVATPVPAWTSANTPYVETGQTPSIQIAAHGTGELIYEVNNIWSLDQGTSVPSGILAGSYVDIVPRLNFKNVTNNQANYYRTHGNAPLIRITHT